MPTLSCMGKNIKIRKGLNIKLLGEAQKVVATSSAPETVAIKPPNFLGVIPKLLVKEKDEVLAGTPLFLDKNNESILFCSPVSGEVAEIVRGDKRVLLAIVILADRETRYEPFELKDPNDLSGEEIKTVLLQAGIWPAIRQRPYGIIANPAHAPKSIFISAFDSHPLAPDYEFIMEGQQINFQTGIDALRKLTAGKLHINLAAGNTGSFFAGTKGAEINYISGPHPAGNVGVQIHHLDPVGKGETVWCINPQDVLTIGRLFNEGRYNASKMIAVTGSAFRDPKYFTVVPGASVKHLLEEASLQNEHARVISGNVLTGSQIPNDGYLDFYDAQITAIPEGDHYEFMGWLAPGFQKFSNSRTFFSWLTPNKKHQLDTNLHGEERPFVMTGQYESVFPMDIYPVHLLKSILVEDIELMEKLGIYEVVEEDFALCEFVCTSKIESQQLIRKGLDIVRRELS